MLLRQLQQLLLLTQLLLPSAALPAAVQVHLLEQQATAAALCARSKPGHLSQSTSSGMQSALEWQHLRSPPQPSNSCKAAQPHQLQMCMKSSSSMT
jgi:hypothetical protein